ncbi:MAG: hypothetical protein A2Y34_08900 [Spirochaetes bacterium GWC1_27_15]|nr:MAG: hypothetical protein A2Y34_08900 [Spirochaetes bacterium GWC1_27_15]
MTKMLLEILGMTNFCNLSCSYCTWDRKKYCPSTKEEIAKNKSNLEVIRETILEKNDNIFLVSYLGGEPLYYPELYKNVLNVFSNKWIQIISNGILINDDIIKSAKNHGKTYFGISLDGATDKANRPRFGNNLHYYDTIIKNIENLLKEDINVLVLCTITKHNIDDIPYFIDFLSNKFSYYIDIGQLAFPAHCVSEYGYLDFLPDMSQVEKYVSFIKSDGHKYPMIERIYPFYELLNNYLLTKYNQRKCNIWNWMLGLHFLGDEIVKGGKFKSYGCGVRGVINLGSFDILSEKSRTFLYNQTFKNKDFNIFLKNEVPFQCRIGCFNDWGVYDMIFNGDLKYNNAEKWFRLFKDPVVKKSVEIYKERNSLFV